MLLVAAHRSGCCAHVNRLLEEESVLLQLQSCRAKLAAVIGVFGRPEGYMSPSTRLLHTAHRTFPQENVQDEKEALLLPVAMGLVMAVKCFCSTAWQRRRAAVISREQQMGA